MSVGLGVGGSFEIILELEGQGILKSGGGAHNTHNHKQLIKYISHT